MQWSADAGAGFSNPGATPWLPFGDHAARNVEDQRRDAASVLHLSRDLIGLRRSTPDLASGRYERLPSPDDVWLYRRGDRTFIALNFSDRRVNIDSVKGRIALSTRRDRDGQDVDGLSLGSWEGVVVAS